MLRFVLIVLLMSGTCAQAQDTVAEIDRAFITNVYQSRFAARPELPDLVIKAFVAGEDRAFYDRSPSFSTLTLHLARIIDVPVVDQHKVLGILIGQSLSRDQILHAYLHSIFLGQNCTGVIAAAQAYFATPPNALAPEQAALLAAIVRAPSDVSQNPQRLRTRRDHILREMVRLGALSLGQGEIALNRPIQLATPLSRCESR
ncbi:MAG: transglycosylase domain-containing protein [Sedimentitalea sp.]